MTDISPEAAVYDADIVAASDAIRAKYLIDDLGDWPPAAEHELAVALDEIKRRHGVPVYSR